MSAPNVRSIVADHLKSAGFDGLLSPLSECCCGFDDMFHCCEWEEPELPGCRPGYKVPCDCDDGCLYHIGPDKPSDEVSG